MPRGCLELLHRVKIRRIDGSIEVIPLQKSRSWVLNFLRIISANLQNTVGASGSDQGLRATTGAWVANTMANAGRIMAWKYGAYGAAADDVYGILVGTGTTSPACSDYAMETKINHGVGAGELQYGDTVVDDALTEGSYFQFLVWRPFTNLSGGSITVQEVGAVTRHRYSGSSESSFMVARDLLNFTILDTEAAVVEYVVRIS